MMKKIALVLALSLITAYTTNICFAAAKQQKKTVSVSPAVYTAISKYKQKNYTGCIQDLTPIVEKDANNDIAQYYIGIAYARLGIKDKAQEAYNNVISTSKDDKLVKYSKKALACLNDQPECSPDYVAPGTPADDEMTVFIKSGKFLHDDVLHNVQEKTLEKQKDRINNDMAPDAYNYKFINDASGSMPTDKEIANAVKVLAKAGINPFNMNMMNEFANPEIAQLNAMMGNNNNMNTMNYMPYIMAQNSGNAEMTKQMIQSMMFSQMMPGL